MYNSNASTGCWLYSANSIGMMALYLHQRYETLYSNYKYSMYECMGALEVLHTLSHLCISEKLSKAQSFITRSWGTCQY